MSKRDKFGNCHICDRYTRLTFEHVPPRAAFNDRKVINTPFENIINLNNLDDLSSLNGPQCQLGAGGYTLCKKCNSDTGAWYGGAFVDWTYQGLILSEHASVAPSLYQIFHIFPLRILKQIICMFFSANHSRFNNAHDELVRFILNKNNKYIDPKYRFYTYFNISDRSRQSGITASLNLDNSNTNVFSEISFPPMGYIMCVNSDPPDNRLLDISHFAHYGYNEFIHMSLNIPILPVYTWLPGDFRSRDTVLKSIKDKD